MRSRLLRNVVTGCAILAALLVGLGLLQADRYVTKAKVLLGKPPDTTYLRELVPLQVKAILDPADTHFSRLRCPAPNPGRYDYLKPSSRGAGKPKWFFALNLREVVGLLPRLMGSIVEAIHFLGPENCVLSIVEGHSTDGTWEVLDALDQDFMNMNISFYFARSYLNPKEGDRIGRLAELRNLALAPLLKSPSSFAPETNVIFLNDVAICLEDILELVHQRLWLNADMTCAVDWGHVMSEPPFYDVWAARAINGDTFFEIPPDGHWDWASDLFFSEPESKERFAAHKPIQVFACWNGAVVIRAKPLMEGLVKFRANGDGECYSAEPTLFCKDLWHVGYGKIATIPTVNLEYDDRYGKRIKASKGYVSDWTKDEDESHKISPWKGPPKQVKCIPNWENQAWRPWDEFLDAGDGKQGQGWLQWLKAAISRT